MNILKWLLHPVLILLIIIGVAIYLNKSGFIPDETGTARHSHVNVGDSQSASNDGAISMGAGAEQAKIAQNSVDESTLAEPIANQPNVAGLASELSTAKVESGDSDSLINEARIAFQQGHLADAIGKYEEARGLKPGNIDILGEQGDVYLRLGRRDEAVRNYSRIATILVEAGEPKQAWDVVEMIWRIDPEKASHLGDQLFK